MQRKRQLKCVGVYTRCVVHRVCVQPLTYVTCAPGSSILFTLHPLRVWVQAYLNRQQLRAGETPPEGEQKSAIRQSMLSEERKLLFASLRKNNVFTINWMDVLFFCFISPTPVSTEPLPHGNSIIYNLIEFNYLRSACLFPTEINTLKTQKLAIIQEQW